MLICFKMPFGDLPGSGNLPATGVFSLLLAGFDFAACGCFLVFHRFQNLFGILIAYAATRLLRLRLLFVLFLILRLVRLFLVLFLILFVLLLFLIFVLFFLILILVLILLLFLQFLLSKPQILTSLVVVGILTQGILVVLDGPLIVLLVESEIAKVIRGLFSN